MFEDRTKSNGYDFKKLDNQARTIVQTAEQEKIDKSGEISEAHARLFGSNQSAQTKEEVKQSIKADIIKHTKNPETLNELPSSKYLSQFENQVAVESNEEELDEATQDSEVDFESLIESSNSVKIDSTVIKKEIDAKPPKPKKNYSFRIKLAIGVYCILVALFGGWVISNTINIAETNTNLYETTTQTEQVNNNILDILSNIKNLDNATGDPDDESIVVKIVTEEIKITPEAITEPNEYTKSSNWFDVFCNWIASLFGGK